MGESNRCYRYFATGRRSLEVRVLPVGGFGKLVLRYRLPGYIVDHRLHVLVAEALDLLGHVRVGVAALAVADPLELAQYVFIVLPVDPGE